MALGFAIERERRVSYDDGRSPNLGVAVAADGDAGAPGSDGQGDATGGFGAELAPNSAGPAEGVFEAAGAHWLLAPATFFARGVEDVARLDQLACDACKEREAVLRPVLARIYRDPDAALARLSEQASSLDVEPRRFSEALAHAPEMFGVPRGSDSLDDGKAARAEREQARAAIVAELIPLARGHASAFKATQEAFRKQETRRRDFMRVGIPALSRLSEIEAVRAHGGESAYSQAFALAAEDRGVVAQIKAADAALSARFGWKAFGGHADDRVARSVEQRLPDGLPHDERTALSEVFGAVRRFAGAQHFAEKRDAALVVAPSAWTPAIDVAAPPPLLGAVTSFAVSVEEEARARAQEVPYYKQCQVELAEQAVLVWRDPVAAVARLEEQYKAGVDPERLAGSVRADPGAFGALRGLDRFMDRFGASGRERRQALETVPAAANFARFAGDA